MTFILDNDIIKSKVGEIKKLSKGLAFPVILDLNFVQLRSKLNTKIALDHPPTTHPPPPTTHHQELFKGF